MSKVKIISPVKKKLDEALNFLKAGKFAEAKSIYLKLKKTIPSNVQLLSNLGAIHIYFGEFELGIELLKKSINIDPNQPNAYSNLSQGLLQKNKKEALYFIEKAIEINSDNPEFYNNRAMIFQDLKRFDDALESINKAIAINSYNPEFYNNRAMIFQDLKRFDDALENFDRAIKIKPNYYEAKFNLSLLNLFKKKFAIGWKLYRERLNCNFFKSQIYTSTKLLYNNEEYYSKILIWGEQGIGDQIFFSRYIPDLIKKHNEVIIFSDERLRALFERSFEKIQFFSKKNEVEIKEYHYHLPIGDLPFFCQIDEEKINQFNKPYIIPNPGLVKKWKQEIHSQKIICGISWKSSNNRFGDEKSINLIELYPILKNTNFLFLNLQYGEISEEIYDLQTKYGIEIKTFKDFNYKENLDGLISLIEVCDFVITVSNITAHLSGAIGKKTYLLAPQITKNIWYWHEKDPVSIWYPSIKILRKENSNSWLESYNFILNDIEIKKTDK